MRRRKVAQAGLGYGLLTMANAALAQATTTAGGRPRVLVIYQPDRPMGWLVDALPVRFTGLPWQEKSERVSIPGMDFQGFALQAFCAGAARTWPHVEFIPLPSFATEQSARAGADFLEAPWPKVLPYGDLSPLLDEHKVTAIIILTAHNGGEDRPQPRGEVGVICVPSGFNLTKNVDEANYRASVRWLMTANVQEPMRRGFWGRSGMKSTYMGVIGDSSHRVNPEVDYLPGLVGSREQVLTALTSRSSEVNDWTRRSLDEVLAVDGMRRFLDRLTMSKERQPYYYTLPF